MEILLWLVPPAAVTVVAMVWVSWLGREGRGEVDREVAVRRLGEALEKPARAPRYAVRPPERDRSTGVAVRPSRATPPAQPSVPAPVPSPVPPSVRAVPPAEEPPQRRVS